MKFSTTRRWLALLLVGIGLAACGDGATAPLPTAVPAAQQPTDLPTVIPATSTAAPTATAASSATLPPATATSAPPSATPAPPSATATTAVVKAVTVTPTPGQGETATNAPAEPPATAVPAQAAPSPTERRYVFPVQGAKVDYGRAHHDYPATDIFCPIGSQFVAPTDGVVDYVSSEDVWDPATNRPEDRGGLAVAIIGDDGVRYYGSHLSQVAEGIAPGVRVAAGQLLGLTGKSGNARNTPPHLHFGISRPTTPDDWQVRRGEISPYPYLRAWQRGEALRPEL